MINRMIFQQLITLLYAPTSPLHVDIFILKEK